MSSAAGLLRGESRTGLKLVAVVLVLVLAAVGGNFIWLGYENENDRQYVALATEIQVMSQQIAKYAGESASGNYDAFNELRATRNQIQKELTSLIEGDTERALPPSPSAMAEALDGLSSTWAPLRENADKILERQNLIADLSDTADEFAARIPMLQSRTDEVAQILAKRGASADQIYIASRQLVIADQMLRQVGDILSGGMAAVTAADGFGRNAAYFGRVLNGLLNGNSEMGIKEIKDAEALEILGGVFNVFDEIGGQVEKILLGSTELFEVKEAADSIFLDSEALLQQGEMAAQAYRDYSSSRPLPSVAVGVIIALIAVVLIILMGVLIVRDEAGRRRSTEHLNARNQEAILRLLDEMGSLAEGDLTVKATVSEDITGAIADSINFAVEALRNLVTAINETAVQVSSGAQETQATAMHLAEASEHQAQQITSASAAINEIAVSIDEVSKNSAESADVAQRSVAIASKGAQVVRETIEGMDNIREQIQETSKRIKRLGESSQEIGDIVELITDISEQTNILALNAAIQASSAGEAGRGFAVVADEVQRLAERTSGATRRIETLVKTIQADTNEAVISMEETTSEVVSGAGLAEDAGEALGEIETVSTDLSDLIQNISEAARQQSAAATNISGTMNVIQEITTQTSAGTGQTAESIGQLAGLAGDLRRSAAGFNLPD